MKFKQEHNSFKDRHCVIHPTLLPRRSTTACCLYRTARSRGMSSSGAGVRGRRGALSWSRHFTDSMFPLKDASCRATQPVVEFRSCTSALPVSTKSLITSEWLFLAASCGGMRCREGERERERERERDVLCVI